MRLLDRIFKRKPPGKLDKLSAALLNLNFLSGSLDKRITFSRTTNATVTGSNGLIQNAPHNLQTFSEQFDNAIWVKTGASIAANTIVAPDGTTTADRFVEDTTTGDHLLQIASGSIYWGTINPSSPYTASVYVKPNGRTKFVLRFKVYSSTGDINALFNLTGSGTVVSSLNTTSATVTPAANGFYRLTISGVSDSNLGLLYLQPASDSATLPSQTSYAGDGVSGVYLWGAQVERGSTATTYNPTTVKNLLGYTEHFDNAAWTKSNAFVQTNLLLYSQDFTKNVPWVPFGSATVSATTVIAPDGTATANALNFSTGGSSNGIRYYYTFTPGVTYTFSLYVRSQSGGTGFSVDIQNALTQGITLTSSWQRMVHTFTPASGTWIDLQLDVAGIVEVWGAQLVQGTSAGDYKATYAAAAAVGYTDIYGQPFAQKLVEDTANNTHRVRQTVSLISAPQTFSVYAKAAERSWVYLVDASIAGGFCYFDLANGVKGTQGANAVGEIASVGNGWYRCSIKVTLLGGGDSFDIRVATSDGTQSYTGDGTSGIYIFGAQLSDSASVDPYVYNPVAAPSAVAYYGPRFDYDPVTLAPKGLLIEEQRTNLLTYSEQFDNAAWVKAGSSVASNAAISPDGTSNADKLVEDTSTGEHKVTQNATLVSGTTYAFSFYAKSAGRTAVGFYGAGGMVSLTGSVDLSTGSVLSGTITVQNVGNGWWRITGFGASTFTGVNSITVRTLAGSASYTGDGTSSIYIWGAQLEAGAFATSYIPTVASQVTRAADSASMIGNNFARWYNQTEGTLFAQYDFAGYSSFNPIFDVGTDQNNIISLSLNSSVNSRMVVVAGGVTQANIAVGLATASTVYKQVGAYKLDDFACTRNNGTLTADTSGTVPFVNQAAIGGTIGLTRSLNGHVSRIAYYPRRLSNTELQGITS